VSGSVFKGPGFDPYIGWTIKNSPSFPGGLQNNQ